MSEWDLRSAKLVVMFHLIFVQNDTHMPSVALGCPRSGHHVGLPLLPTHLQPKSSQSV